VDVLLYKPFSSKAVVNVVQKISVADGAGKYECIMSLGGTSGLWCEPLL